MEDTYGEAIEAVVASAGQQASHDDADSVADDGGAPKLGTLAWLQAQPTVTLANGETVPACHRIPAGAELVPPDADSRCRVLTQSGDRCKGTRLKAYGLCMGHLGGGGTADLDAMRERAAAKQRSLKLTRQVLGFGPARSADPRVLMRVRAAQRAFELAQAVVDGPLDDRKIGTIERQTAALKALDATFPLQTGTVELSLSEPDDMSWKDMKQLALSLLG